LKSDLLLNMWQTLVEISSVFSECTRRQWRKFERGSKNATIHLSVCFVCFFTKFWKYV